MTYQQYRFSFGYGLTPVIKKLIIITAVVFLLQMVVDYKINFYLGLVPLLVWKKIFLWQLFTYIFLHGDVSHILFNLLALWMFGGELENYWGSRKFLFYFFFCGIGAGICTVIFSPYQLIPVIGASGAIYGILLAFGWLFPNRLIYIYFLFPIPAKYFVRFMAWNSLFKEEQRRGCPIHSSSLLLADHMALLLSGKIRREYQKNGPKSPGSGGYYH
jgi:membrane associated rhomboid family serine protease